MSPDRATPLTNEEQLGLLLPVLTRRDLDEAEADNITRARSWLFNRRTPVPTSAIVSERWLRELHRRMYHEVWSWAGTYRTTERNLGVPPWQIASELHMLIEDVRFWLQATGAAKMPDDEIAVRMSHRAVVIHPYPNGNGRWSRLLADALAVSLGRPLFSWGSTSLSTPSTLRQNYVDALRKADKALDYAPLLVFARS